MEVKTLKALKASIAKYEKRMEAMEGATRIIRMTKTGYRLDNGKFLYVYSDDRCPLCKLYYSLFGCEDGCPVKQYSRMSGCKKTPFDKITSFSNDNQLSCFSDIGIKDVSIADLRTATQAELDFLKSLLPDNCA